MLKRVISRWKVATEVVPTEPASTRAKPKDKGAYCQRCGSPMEWSEEQKTTHFDRDTGKPFINYWDTWRCAKTGHDIDFIERKSRWV